jgi:hypothetical protein
VVPANRVEATVWAGGECGSQCGYGERERERERERRSVIQEIITGVMSRQRRKLT